MYIDRVQPAPKQSHWGHSLAIVYQQLQVGYALLERMNLLSIHSAIPLAVDATKPKSRLLPQSYSSGHNDVFGKMRPY